MGALLKSYNVTCHTKLVSLDKQNELG